MSDVILPYIVGPITPGTSFLIGSYNSFPQLFLLSVQEREDVLAYVWELADDIITMNIKGLGVFTASGTTDNLFIKDQENGGGLAMKDTTLINSRSIQSFQMVQIAYQPWNPPDILLSRTVYSLLTKDGSQIIVPGHSGSFPAN